MAYPILKSSPKAKQIHENGVVKTVESKYPYAELNVGMSFSVPKEEANVPSLRAGAHRHSKDGKKFIVVVHDDMEPPCVEVARMA